MRCAKPDCRGVRALLLVLFVGLGAAACDDAHRGPTTLQGVIEGPSALGAAYFVLPAEGVLGVETEGGSWIFSHERVEEGMIRVVLVAGAESAGPLRFRVRVEDARAPLPQAALVELADFENRRLSGTAGYTIRIRP